MVPVLISCCGAYCTNYDIVLAHAWRGTLWREVAEGSLSALARTHSYFCRRLLRVDFLPRRSWVEASNMSSALIWHAARGWSRPVPATPLTFFQALLLVYAALHCLLFPSTTDLFRAFLLKDRDIAQPYSAWIWSPTLTWALSAGAMAGIACWLLLETRFSSLSISSSRGPIFTIT